MRTSIRLGRIFGVRVGVNWSVLVIAWLLSWSLASVQLPDRVTGRTETAYWIAGVVAAAGFIGAILAHELGHALAARRAGVETEEIVLWMFGGMAKLKSFGASARSELSIALAGPVVSLAIGVGALIGAAAADATDRDRLIVEVLAWLGIINLVLLIFNLIPAAPLDGGRVLSAVLWKRWNDERRAHQASAQVGRGLGAFMVGLGVLSLLISGAIGGLWIVLLGWFLINAADAELSTWEIKTVLAGRTVRDVMTAPLVTVPPEAPLDWFVDNIAAVHRHAAYPVIESDGRPIGLLTLKELSATPRPAWSTTTVREIMSPLEANAVAKPDTLLTELLTGDQQARRSRVLVVDGTRLVGIIAPSDLARLIEVETLARATPARPREATRDDGRTRIG